MSLKYKILIFIVSFIILCVGGVTFLVISINQSLPTLITIKDYQPLLVSSVYSSDQKKIGEFSRERRVLTPMEKIPKHVVHAFLAAEDDQFYEHKGINLIAITRAMLANIKAGKNIQGGSTITQQVAKTLMLSNERTLSRKIKDVLLALKMEKNLSKDDILFLYLNQIYFGQGAYGVEMASQTYFHKSIEKITVAEAAVLAGLPKAPSAYSPLVNPKRAKERQIYVLKRMSEVGYIDNQTTEKSIQQPLTVYVKEKYETVAPFYLETLRQLLIKKLGESVVLDSGLKIYTGLDYDKQIEAQKNVEQGLRDLDKRQGYRGPLKNLKTPEEQNKFLEDEKKILLAEASPIRQIDAQGKMTIIQESKKSGSLPEYYKLQQIVEGVITKIDDSWGLVEVQAPEVKGLIDIETMGWARKPDPLKKPETSIVTKPSEVFSVGDVISVKIESSEFSSERLNQLALQKNKSKKGKAPNTDGFALFKLEQDPVVQGALLSLDLNTQEVIAMVGGLNFEKSEFNRTTQATRQTGSSFKSIVYASALDKGFTAATPILDAPVVFEENVNASDQEGQDNPKDGDNPQTKTWKPTNHSKSFEGDILFRNALIKSLNVPTVRIIEDIGVSWAADYARRLGIFSPLNKDFTLSLGSSSVTLYEMTKAFAHFGRQGKRIRPLLIHKVVDKENKVLLENISLDERFESEINPIEEEFEKRRKAFLENKEKLALEPENEELKKLISKEPPLFFEDPDQLIDPKTAYLITTLLKSTIDEAGGTATRARSLGREVAGKTGSTSKYFDGWFIGYTPQISTGVWVGFDQEKSIGVGEVGAKTAIPIWLPYMQYAHRNIPETTFSVPDGIVFASIDNKTGTLPTSSSRNIVRQAFKEGTEPTASSSQKEEETDFYKQDLSE